VVVLTVLAMLLNGIVGLIGSRTNRWKPLENN
jgi:hypothetical protein